MKITEKSTQRMFTLDISEEDFQNLVGNLVFYPVDEELRTEGAREFIGKLRDQAMHLNVSVPPRSNFVKEPK